MLKVTTASGAVYLIDFENKTLTRHGTVPVLGAVVQDGEPFHFTEHSGPVTIGEPMWFKHETEIARHTTRVVDIEIGAI